MKLHIDLDSSHPAYAWLEKQADKIGARGHFGTHIDCYTSTPSQSEYHLPAFVLNCCQGMPEAEIAAALPSLDGKALILYTGNMDRNDYGAKAYFDETDTSVGEEVLKVFLSKHPQLILIDSYGIGKHGAHHIELDKMCEQCGCYVVENIRITPLEAELINRVNVCFDLDYPSTGKPCRVTAE
ncbi:cyclase family protein [Phocaeicola sp.]